MAFESTYGLADRIEDLISKNSKSPSSLQKELKGILEEGVTVDDFKNALDGTTLFGDPKLNEIIINSVEGKPLDSSYIQSIDFSSKEFSEEVIGRLEDQCHKCDQAFLDTVVKPTFVTDWPVHKHEMVSSFELPVYDAEHIVNGGDLNVLCSPTTVSMLDYISQSVPSIPASMVNDPERAEVLVARETELKNIGELISELKGPTLDEYLEGLGITTLDPKIVNDLTDGDSLGLSRVKASLHGENEDFGEFKPKTIKGSLYKAINLFKRLRSKFSDNSGDASEGVGVERLDGEAMTPSDISRALMYTGTALGREHLLEPSHISLWESMRRDGLDKVIPMRDTNLGKISGECDYKSPADEILVIMATKPEDRAAEFRNYKYLAKPGDFFEVYEFCQNFSAKPYEEGVEALSDSSKVLKGLERRKSEIPMGPATYSAPKTQGGGK